LDATVVVFAARRRREGVVGTHNRSQGMSEQSSQLDTVTITITTIDLDLDIKVAITSNSYTL